MPFLLPTTSQLRAWAAGSLAIGLVFASSASRALDEELYAGLLSRYTREVQDTAGTRVDYAGLRREPKWPQLIASVRRSEPGALKTKAERLAFWINSYNILTIDMLVRAEPVESIRDLGSITETVWQQPAGRVGKRSFTLDEIEHEILRPMDEPRIHAAIVCASTSCPSLLREPWTAKQLEEQFVKAMRKWLADPQKGFEIDRRARLVHLSSIFDWYEEDFDTRGGALEFIRSYIAPRDRVWLSTNKERARVEYLEYDWTINEVVHYPAGQK